MAGKLKLFIDDSDWFELDVTEDERLDFIDGLIEGIDEGKAVAKNDSAQRLIAHRRITVKNQKRQAKAAKKARGATPPAAAEGQSDSAQTEGQ